MNEPLRIVHYYPRALRGDGGVTNAVWAWARGQGGAGYTTEVWGAATGPLADSSSFSLTRPTIRRLHHYGAGRVQFASPLALNRAIAEAPPGVVYLHSAWSPHNYWAAAYLLRRGIPYVVMPHGAYRSRQFQSRGVGKWIAAPIERWLISRAAAVHVFFFEEAEELEHFATPRRILVVPTGIELETGRAKPHPDAPDRVKIGWLGRYDVHVKGLDVLKKAAVIAGTRFDLQLHGKPVRGTTVLDVGAMFSMLPRVRVAGPVYGSEKEAFLLQLDVYVQPSRWEAHSISVLDALACGLPVIVTSSQPIANIIAEYEAGIIVGPDDPQALARALRILISDSALRQRMGRAAELLVSKHFSWPSICLRLRPEYAELCSRSNG